MRIDSQASLTEQLSTKDSRSTFTRLQMAHCFISLTALSGAFIWMGQPDELQSENHIAKYIWFSVYAPVALFASGKLTLIARNAWRQPLAWILAIETVLSPLWSVQPLVSLKQSIWFLMGVLFSSFLATHYDNRRRLYLLTSVTRFTLIASLLFVVLLPSIGVHQDALLGMWRGVFKQRNYLARYASLHLLLVFVESNWSGRRRFLWGDACLALILLLGSRGKGALVSLIVTIGCVACLYGLSVMRVTSRIALLSCSIILIIIVGWNSPVIVATFLEVSGRDATLTGRIPLWTALSYFVSNRPLLGYGFDAFFTSSLGRTLSLLKGWNIAHSHNALLDVMIQLGVVGLCIYLLLVVTAGIRLYYLMGRSDKFAILGSLGIFMYIQINTMTEANVIIRPHDLMGVLFFSMCFSRFEADDESDAPKMQALSQGVSLSDEGPDG